MLALISPAKKLDFEHDSPLDTHSQSDFLAEANILAKQAKSLTRADLTRLMGISDKLADLNYQRYQDFSTPFNLGNAKQAAYAFKGDTYVGLEAESLSPDDMHFAQDHLRILSGLYGLLRPLDLMQAYRLEMGTKFKNPKGEDLYDFWHSVLGRAVNDTVQGHKDKSVINLASNEYIKSINLEDLNVPFITPHFKEVKDGKAKTIGLFAKRARGMMARYMIENRIESAEDLKKFNTGGYTFQSDLSNDTDWVFTRPQPAKKS